MDAVSSETNYPLQSGGTQRAYVESLLGLDATDTCKYRQQCHYHLFHLSVSILLRTQSKHPAPIVKIAHYLPNELPPRWPPPLLLELLPPEYPPLLEEPLDELLDERLELPHELLLLEELLLELLPNPKNDERPPRFVLTLLPLELVPLLGCDVELPDTPTLL